MFHTSSQRKYWIFKSPEQLQEIRTEVNSAYKARYRDTFANKRNVSFLSAEEEKSLVEYYELVLRDVSGKFQPPVPSTVTATATSYLKRFYLKTSVMDHPPKEMFLVCLYMACKVEEYNISVDRFVQILPSDRREKVMDFILAHELLLMQRLDFHLTLHHPYRPLEGFMIDMKTRMSINPEKWRSKAEDFLRRTLHTDISLLYSPSQIAMAALHTGSSRDGELEGYVRQTVGDSEKSTSLWEVVKTIVDIVNSKTFTISKDQIKILEQRLKACRNPEHNPDGKLFKRKKADKSNDDVIPEKRACQDDS